MAFTTWAAAKSGIFSPSERGKMKKFLLLVLTIALLMITSVSVAACSVEDVFSFFGFSWEDAEPSAPEGGSTSGGTIGGLHNGGTYIAH